MWIQAVFGLCFYILEAWLFSFWDKIELPSFAAVIARYIKKRVNFKTGRFFGSVESFLYCLNSRELTISLPRPVHISARPGNTFKNNCFKIHTRGREWLKYHYKLFLFYPYHIMEAVFIRLNLRLSRKSYSYLTFLTFKCVLR